MLSVIHLLDCIPFQALLSRYCLPHTITTLTLPSSPITLHLLHLSSLHTLPSHDVSHSSPLHTSHLHYWHPHSMCHTPLPCLTPCCLLRCKSLTLIQRLPSHHPLLNLTPLQLWVLLGLGHRRYPLHTNGMGMGQGLDWYRCTCSQHMLLLGFNLTKLVFCQPFDLWYSCGTYLHFYSSSSWMSS